MYNMRLMLSFEELVGFMGTEEKEMEKEMATHSSSVAWQILWMEKPGRLQSMGWQRGGHDWLTSLYGDWGENGGRM